MITLEPVRDMEGFTVWRVRVLGEGERTCLRCGETFAEGGFCSRCARRTEDGRIIAGDALSVPTVSYLRPDEIEVIR